jgi:hypothetical protein
MDIFLAVGESEGIAQVTRPKQSSRRCSRLGRSFTSSLVVVWAVQAG